jgi:hypothetical protein
VRLENNLLINYLFIIFESWRNLAQTILARTIFAQTILARRIFAQTILARRIFAQKILACTIF